MMFGKLCLCVWWSLLLVQLFICSQTGTLNVHLGTAGDGNVEQDDVFTSR